MWANIPLQHNMQGFLQAFLSPVNGAENAIKIEFQKLNLSLDFFSLLHSIWRRKK